MVPPLRIERKGLGNVAYTTCTRWNAGLVMRWSLLKRVIAVICYVPQTLPLDAKGRHCQTSIGGGGWGTEKKVQNLKRCVLVQSSREDSTIIQHM